MAEAIVFNGLNSLDFYEVRKNVCRIPEVVSRIRAAQSFIDAQTELELDVLNFIGSDDKTFLNHIRFKSLAACIVQVGLYDRYLTRNKFPQFFIGNINGDSAMKVACGVMSFEHMLKNSTAFGETDSQESVQGVVALQAGSEPVLSGFSLTEYAVFKRLPEEEIVEDAAPYVRLEIEPMAVDKIIHKLVDEEELKKVVNIGPGNLLVSRTSEDLILEQLTILESIDLDPMLSWFWPSLKESSIAV